MLLKRPSGGVKPTYPWPGKDTMLQNIGSYTAFTPEKVYLPLQQNIGAPCKPVVAPGDTVLLGQLIGDSDEKVSGKVHASVSGKVLEIKEWPLAGGGTSETVIIENDGLDTPCAAMPTYSSANPPAKEDILNAVQQAGIVGMGGATFPTHVKLDTGDYDVEYCLVNGAECEPMLAADDALMRSAGKQVLQGALYVMRATGATRGVVGIEENKPDSIEVMRALCEDVPEIEVEVLPRIYPQGGEKQLVESLTGREVPDGGGLPAEVGAVVVNVATAAAITEALQNGMPLTHRIVTVTGDVQKPQNVCFPIGTLAQDLIDFCGGFRGVPSKVIAGGPMMGNTLEDLAVPLTKGSNGLIVYNEAHDRLFEEEPCIRCNQCVDACPMKMMPLLIDKAWRKKDMRACKRLSAASCINCGCCSYTCPTLRPLAENIMAAKGKLGEMEKEEEDG